ncbi:MAG: hypothetical protein ACRCUT_11475, partial [Spirochaetota bacterium]
MADNTASFSKGDILVLQGEASPWLYYLMAGSVEILSAPAEYAGLDKSIITEHSVRVGLINEKTFIAGISGKTIRAMDNVTVQKFSGEGGFSRFALEDPARGVTLLSHLFRRLELTFADLSKVVKLYQNLCVVGDNLSLMSSEVSAGEPPERIEHRVELLVDTFKKSGGAFPKGFDANFLITDHSGLLKKKYATPGEPVETLIDRDLYAFFKRFLKIDKNIFAHLIKADPEIAIFIFNKVSANLVRIIDKISLVYDSIDEEMEILFGD